MNRHKQPEDDLVKPDQGDKGGPWDDYFRKRPPMSEDFMIDRDQGVAEEREPFC